MQGEQLSILELLLLVVFSAASLFGLKVLHSSPAPGGFRTGSISEDPKWPTMGLVVVIFALCAYLIFPGIVMLVLEEVWDSGLHKDEEMVSASSMTGGILLGGGFIALSILFLVKDSLKLPLSSLGLRAAPLTNLLPVVLLYALFFFPLALLALLWMQLLEVLGYEPMAQEVVKMFMDALERGNLLEISLMVFNAVILAPLWEELIFRGLFFGYLKSRMPVLPALLFSSLVFAAYHFNLAALLPLLIVGIAAGYVYERTRSLYFAIFFHAFFNGLSMVIQIFSAGS